MLRGDTLFRQRRPRHVCPHMLRGIACTQRTPTGLHVYVLVVSPSQPQAHTCVATCRHTSTPTCPHWLRCVCMARDSQYTTDTCHHPSGTESQSTGPTGSHMKQTWSPRLCASPRLVFTTIRATYSCWHDTGSHCAARPRGTMGAYFFPLRTRLPGSLELGAQRLFQRLRETPQRLRSA